MAEHPSLFSARIGTNERTVSDAVQQPWVVLANGFVYGPFESRREAGAWCVEGHKRNAQVMPLNDVVPPDVALPAKPEECGNCQADDSGLLEPDWRLVVLVVRSIRL